MSNAIKRLFMDCETSPNVGYFWRAGFDLRIDYDNIVEERAIICICWKWEHEKEVHYLTWDRRKNDKAMLQKFSAVIAKADEVVGHNGDRFDIPWFRTRCLFHRIPAFPKYVSVDTLKKARGGFTFNSNKLDYIGQYLGVGKKRDTGGFGLWKDVMAGDEKALADMVKYCQQDVKLLEAVYQRMQSYFPHRTHDAIMGGTYKHHCPICGSDDTKRNKRTVTAAGTEQVQMLHKDCGKPGKNTYWTLGEATYINETRMEEDEKTGKATRLLGKVHRRRIEKRAR